MPCSLKTLATNSSWHGSIQNTPFALNGGEPVVPELVGLPSGEGGKTLSAVQFARKFQESIMRAKHSLQKAQQRMAQYYNSRRVDVSFKPGELVLLSTTNLRQRLKYGQKGAGKLLPRFIGPLKVLKLVGKAAVQLELPAGWTRVHNVFHVSLVRHYKSDGKVVHFPPPPDLENSPYVVERVVTHRIRRGGKGKQYLVRWKGYGPERDTWETRARLAESLYLVKRYHQYAGLPLDAGLRLTPDEAYES
jgi:hypothetical protein